MINLHSSFPVNLLQVYIEDALGDRVWVDLPSCQQFTANVCTVFNTLNKPEEGVATVDESDPLHSVLLDVEIQPR